MTSSLAVIPAVWSDYIATVCRKILMEVALYVLLDGGMGEGQLVQNPEGFMELMVLFCWLVGCISAPNEVMKSWSYNRGLLQQIPTAYLVPFQLRHRTGFTNELMTLIESMVTAGVSLCGIRDMFFRKICLHYNTVKSRFSTLCSMLLPHDFSHTTFPTFEEWRTYFPSLVPSRHAISACFLASFWKRAHLYKLYMQRIRTDSHDGWLSCDHTFKSAGEYLI